MRDLADRPPRVLADGEEISLGHHKMDYYSHSPETRALIDKLAATEPTTLACMHGASFRGDGGNQLRKLKLALSA